MLVVAPSDNINVFPITYEGSQNAHRFTEEIENSGVYNIYYKGELMGSFNGKSKPLFDNPTKTIEKYKKMYDDRHSADKIKNSENQ